MAEEQKQEIIRELTDSWENIKTLVHMLNREKWNVEQELALATKAKQSLGKTLSGLTGDKFYEENEVLK